MTLRARFLALLLLGLGSCVSTPAVRTLEPISEQEALFGYRRERVLSGRETSYVYVRAGRDGRSVEVDGARFAAELAPSIARLWEALPATVGVALAACPELAREIAILLEAGAIYEGEAEGANRHPHARGRHFWSRAQLRVAERGGEVGEYEDPVDTLIWLLLEALNAANADGYHSIWEDVLAGRLGEEDYLWREARAKAVQLLRAVKLVRENEACLQLDGWLPGFGLVFQEYERWAQVAGHDDGELARLILANTATYADNPEEQALSYGERLRGLWRQHSPLARSQ
jgi:hypothetical protein